MFKKVESRQKFPEMEKEIIEFWKENKTFQKSLDNRKDAKEYTFYDGPPFATGLPHYGHLVGSIMKDVVPRYWTMRGFYVERKWGWDCHGLPIENIVEKEMGSQKKKDIEALGVDKFNELCRSKVLGYVDDWEKAIERLGRWADMENAYRTMDKDFMESVWWVFKELFDKGLVYESYRSMHICPRCETTLSQSEVAEGYQDIKDLSVTAKFELVDEPNTFILAWTTTPWTLPGNVALAVGEDIDYVKIEKESWYKNVFLISGKHAFASDSYFQKLKEKLEKNGYNVTIIDHKNNSNPNLKENLELLEKYDFNNSHVIVHSLGSSTFLKFLENKEVKIESLTMIAPTYPGKSFSSTNPDWVKNSGYTDFELDFEKIKNKISNKVDVIYSDENIIKEEHFLLLGGKLNANLHKEENKGHFFEKGVTNEPNFKIDFSERFILAKAKLEEIFGEAEYKIIEELKGEKLIGKKYKPLFNTYSENESLENRENGWKVYGADFVTTEDGTGVVHIAPAFGEDDMNLGKENNLPFVQHVGMDGNFKEELKNEKEFEEFAKLNLSERFPEKKGVVQIRKADKMIVNYLEEEKKIFNSESYDHSYPHCWRCDTPLINYATSSWFIAVTKIKDKLLETAKEVNWSPAHLKEGRFGNWLEGARDWSISRQRFWASAIPIWKCECGEMKVFGNVADLEKISGEKIDDLHKHVVDKIVFPCEKCSGEMHRIPDVLDTWFDSGSMPYAQKHYPFENKEKFENTFPADFIAEGIDQTRAWFYYLHTIAGAIKGKPAFKNVIANGIVLAEDGKKMSKKLQNYPNPMEMFEKYGADSIRYYLMASPVVAAQNLNFSEKDVSEVVRGMMRMLWNSYSFFVLYANIDKWEAEKNFSAEGKTNLLDKWIVSELQVLIREFNNHMEAYELHKAARLLPKFTDNLSNWYIRRSRKRFWKSEDDGDKNDAYATLHYVLVELSKVMAPFTPFMAEEVYKNLMNSVETKDFSSVHLAEFPETNEELIDEKLNEQVENLRDVISEGLQLRSQNKLKVRQPLSKVTVKKDFNEEMQEIIKEELNVKEVIFNENLETDIVLDTEITPELKLEGQAREIIRHIQQMRKNADYQVDDRINVSYQGGEEVFEKFGEMIVKEVLAEKFEKGTLEEFDLEKELDVDGEKIVVRIKK